MTTRELRPLASLKATAARRKPGYLDACLSLGQLDQSAGMVKFTPENWLKIRQEFALPKAPVASAVPKTVGLGDAIHKVAGPIGRRLKWPCLKGDGTTNLKPGSPCDKARKLLNKL